MKKATMATNIAKKSAHAVSVPKGRGQKIKPPKKSPRPKRAKVDKIKKSSVTHEMTDGTAPSVKLEPSDTFFDLAGCGESPEKHAKVSELMDGMLEKGFVEGFTEDLVAVLEVPGESVCFPRRPLSLDEWVVILKHRRFSRSRFDSCMRKNEERRAARHILQGLVDLTHLRKNKAGCLSVTLRSRKRTFYFELKQFEM